MQRYKIYLIYTSRLYTSRRKFSSLTLPHSQKAALLSQICTEKMQKSPKSAPQQCKIAQKSWKSVNLPSFVGGI